MDPSQYKDYVLSILFIKYVSDKYAGHPYAAIKVPAGSSFKDLVALKGRSDIGDQINKKIIAPIANENKLGGFPDFADAGRFGSGKQMVDTLTGLVATFEHPDLDFSKNRADGDDILGDAYEFLMRHFATESGKAKGQFYTPAEVSRVMAQIVGIRNPKTTNQTTVYDPTCGSGSLLIKVADEAGARVTLYGQEKDGSTAGLARMNLILHDYPGAVIHPGQSTLANPAFLDNDRLKTFDYVVANPPFSDKRWRQGMDPNELKPGFALKEESPDTVDHHRFDGFGVPPPKRGDYAYLLHIIKSLKPMGNAACILPHGVLFRGNAEADIRKNLIQRGLIRAIIGLPANLFYGTGIPACIVVIDKENAAARRAIFMIDGSRGFMKDGPKNRLREMDVHRIVDVFRRGQDVPKYARLVGYDLIEANGFNLNLPRYIDSQPPEDRHDIAGHLQGGIPERDVAALADYWAVCPSLKTALFKPSRLGYDDLAVEPQSIRAAIHEHPEFRAFTAGMARLFAQWREAEPGTLKALAPGFHPKAFIAELSERLLKHYQGRPLIDAYAVYQHLMAYWAESMQDDAYLIAGDGWWAATYRVLETKKGKDGKDKTIDKGWACDLVPKELLVARLYAKEAAAIAEAEAERERVAADMLALEEEHGNEDGLYSELIEDGEIVVTEKAAKARLKEIKGDRTAADEVKALTDWLALADREKALKRAVRDAEAALDDMAYKRYPRLTEAEVKALCVDGKWMAALEARIAGETTRAAAGLTRRVRELSERYGTPMAALAARVTELEAKVAAHHERMGFGTENVNRNLENQHIVQELLTGKRRLRGFMGEWTTAAVGDLFDFGRTVPLSRAQLSPDGDVKYVHYGDIHTRLHNHLDFQRTPTPGAYRLLCGSATALKVGDRVFADASEDYDGVAKAVEITRLPMDKGAVAGLHTFVLREREKTFAPGFKGYLANATTFRAQVMRAATGMKVFGISKSQMKSVELRFPPTLDEQRAIAAVLSDMDAEIAALEAKLAKARAVKQGMTQVLLTGEIRLT